MHQQFGLVAEAMVELGQADEALAWARRGIAETSGWQVAKLYDLAARLLAESSALEEVVELRRQQHERDPGSSTYASLRAAARATGTWDAEIEPARTVLGDQNRRRPTLIAMLDKSGLR